MNFHFKRDFDRLRHEMVEKAIVGRGVRSEPVLAAMRSVPREAFLPKELREFAYEDAPLPIEQDQTISQPYIVAFHDLGAWGPRRREAPGARPFEKKIVGVTDPRPCDELIDKSAIFPGE